MHPLLLNAEQETYYSLLFLLCLDSLDMQAKLACPGYMIFLP